MRLIKSDVIILLIILSVALSLRLYNINAPLADWHSWRQADTAAVARNYSQNGINLFYPVYDDISNIQSGQYNPKGYRFVEFPIYNAVIALLHSTFGLMPIEVYGRLITVFSSLIIIAILYWLTLHEVNRTAAIVASGIYAAFPFFVYYSRVVLPETTALAFSMSSVGAAYMWTHGKGKSASIFLFLSAILASIAILIKPPAIFYVFPVMYLIFTKYRFRLITRISPYIFTTIALTPFILWRMWVKNFPEGVPLFDWLITTANTYEGKKNIFFRPAFFRWVFHERIQELIMGGYAAIFPILGAVTNTRKSLLIHSLGVAALLHLLVFQGGNVQHDYYQSMILPGLAALSGLGVSRFLTKDIKNLHLSLNYLVVFLVLVFSAAMSFYQVKGYYSYSEDLINTAKIIGTLTPKDSLIVTDREGDTTLLYLANRKGMPAVTEPLPELKEKGMEYFYTSKSDVAEETKKSYKLIFENNSVFIFKL